MATGKKQEDIQSESMATEVIESFMTKLKERKFWKCGTPKLKALERQERLQQKAKRDSTPRD